MGHLGEVEVQRQVFALVPDGEHHVAALVLSALAELKRLPVDLDLWVLGPRHHLNLEVRVLDADFIVFIEADDGQRGVILGLDSVATLVNGHARLGEAGSLSVLAAGARDGGTGWVVLGGRG